MFEKLYKKEFAAVRKQFKGENLTSSTYRALYPFVANSSENMLSNATEKNMKAAIDDMNNMPEVELLDVMYKSMNEIIVEK